jgi:hypothetical protein
MKRIATLLAAVAALPALAHPGHGLRDASHWHATDTLGLLVVVALAGTAIWFSGRK